VFNTGAVAAPFKRTPKEGRSVMQDQPCSGLSDPHASETGSAAALVIAPGGALRIFEDARRQIADAVTVDQVKHARDLAIGLAAAARAATDKELEAEAAVLKFEADRKLGQLMKAQAEAVGLNTGTAGQGRPALGGFPENPPKKDDRPTLAEAGIDKNLAHRARTAAAMSEPEFKAAVEAKREAVRAPELRIVGGAEQPAPRKRKSRSKVAKAEAAVKAETERIETIAFKTCCQIDLLVDLHDENPKRFAAVFDHLANDTNAIDALSVLARQPAIKTLLAKVAPCDAGSTLSPANAAELEHELARLKIAHESEVKELKAEIARLREGAAPDSNLKAELAKLSVEGTLRVLPDTTKDAMRRRIISNLKRSDHIAGLEKDPPRSPTPVAWTSTIKALWRMNDGYAENGVDVHAARSNGGAA
jgi:hypothetical protein